MSHSRSNSGDENDDEEKGYAVIEGYVHKRGQYNKIFKKRWLVLYSNNTLIYYENPNHVQYQQSLGTISIYDILKIAEQQHDLFHITTTKRKFTLKCDTNKQRQNWMNRIKCRQRVYFYLHTVQIHLVDLFFFFSFAS